MMFKSSDSLYSSGVTSAFDLTAVFMLDALPDMTPKELLSLPGMKQETMELLSVTIIIINSFLKDRKHSESRTCSINI